MRIILLLGLLFGSIKAQVGFLLLKTPDSVDFILGGALTFVITITAYYFTSRINNKWRLVSFKEAYQDAHIPLFIHFLFAVGCAFLFPLAFCLLKIPKGLKITPFLIIFFVLIITMVLCTLEFNWQKRKIPKIKIIDHLK